MQSSLIAGDENKKRGAHLEQLSLDIILSHLDFLLQ